MQHAKMRCNLLYNYLARGISIYIISRREMVQNDQSMIHALVTDETFKQMQRWVVASFSYNGMAA